MKNNYTELSKPQIDELLIVLKDRFLKNMHRHKDFVWESVESMLKSNPQKIWSVSQMEATGGEPDIVRLNNTNDYIFVDCSAQTPTGRRSICFDRQALELRKQNKPHNSAMDMANVMGVEILSEQQYRELQKYEEFDTKTSSWVATPKNIRLLGGALFCDRRYNTVFTYHNGADSYYSARGFRAMVKIN